MAGKSAFLENKVLDHVLGATSYTAPATVYFALFTSAPTDAGGGTEVAGGSYARSAVTNNATNFPNAVSSQKTNGSAVGFAGATASWGTVVAVGVFDALTSGNLLYWTMLNVAKTIADGDTASFPIGSLVFIED